MDQNKGKSSTPLIIGGVALVLVAGVVGASVLQRQNAPASTNNTGNSTNTNNTDTDSNNDSANSTAQTSSYQDGTYTASGEYTSPAGAESVGVQVTLENGLISNVEITPEASNPTSRSYQNKFASGIGELVQGKAIDSSFDLTSVNGSSLTPNGFEAALQDIMNQAQV